MNAPTCDRLRELLSGSQNDTDRLVVDVVAHLATCSVCRAEEAELSDLLARYCQSTSSPLRDDLEARLLDRLCVTLRN